MATTSSLATLKKLIERYETITLEEIEKAWKKYNIDWDSGVACHLTGFGACDKCTLCKVVRSNCGDCIYSKITKYQAYRTPCLHIKGYQRIQRANTPKRLLSAYRNRASVLKGLLIKAGDKPLH